MTFQKRLNSGDSSSGGCRGDGRGREGGAGNANTLYDAEPWAHVISHLSDHRKRRPGPPPGALCTLGERPRSSEQVTHTSPPVAAVPSVLTPAPPRPASTAPSIPAPRTPSLPRLAAGHPAMLCPASSLCSELLKAGTVSPRRRWWPRDGTSPYRVSEQGGRGRGRGRRAPAAPVPWTLHRRGGACLPPCPSARPAVSNCSLAGFQPVPKTSN